jgi:hypothetical protein
VLFLIDTFGEASKQLPKALLTSNLESADEDFDKNTSVRRRRKGKTHAPVVISSSHQSSSDEDENSLSSPLLPPPGNLHSAEGNFEKLILNNS